MEGREGQACKVRLVSKDLSKDIELRYRIVLSRFCSPGMQGAAGQQRLE